MLINLLTQKFNNYFNESPNNNLILWFDPKNEYHPIIGNFTEVDIWELDNNNLEVRYRINNREPGQKTVVHIPKSNNDAEILRPYFSTSLLFQKSIYKVLSEEGLNFPADPKTKHRVRDILPQLAQESIGKGKGFWVNTLASLEKAREALLGNFDEVLLRYLTNPHEIDKQLENDQTRDIFFALLESKYGVDIQITNDVEEIIQEITAPLILVNAVSIQGPEDTFPFLSKLPDPVYHQKCRSFLRRWQRDNAYKDSYKIIADQLEKRYNIAPWLKHLTLSEKLSLPVTFYNIEKSTWEDIEKEMSSLISEEDWLTWLTQHKDKFHDHADNYWSSIGQGFGWEFLILATKVLTRLNEIQNEFNTITNVERYLDRYLTNWWHMDQDYRKLKEVTSADLPSLDKLQNRCARSYNSMLRKINDRFSELLGSVKTWPPTDTLPTQETFWTDIMAEAGENEKFAILYIDALRYELAKEVIEELDKNQAGEQRELSARIASIPTVTSIGMSALLPRGEDRQIDYADDWEITVNDSKNLKDKSNRKDWLSGTNPDIEFFNLDEFLSTTLDSLKANDQLVIFDTTLDALGENAKQLSWNAFSSLLQSLIKGVHKLLDLGINEIHIVTDHGFILLDELGEHEKVKVKNKNALAIKPRYVVGKNLGSTDQLAYRLSKSEDLEVWFPRGIGCFKTPGPYSYVHGGLSLQELIIPQLKITRQEIGQIVEISVDLPSEINNARFTVEIQPIEAEMFDQSRQVTVDLLKKGEKVIPTLSKVIDPGGPSNLDILLPMGCGLKPGEKVQWEVRDAHTEEILHQKEAISKVDLW